MCMVIFFFPKRISSRVHIEMEFVKFSIIKRHLHKYELRFFLEKEYNSTIHSSLDLDVSDDDVLQEIYFEHNYSSSVLGSRMGDNC